MATALSIGAATGAAPPLHRFTVDEFNEVARAALFGEDDRYGDSARTASDAIRVIEVADTSLRADREFKAPLYARQGVAEHWIVNPVDRQVEIFRAPSEGQYAIRLAASGDDVIAALALPAARTAVASIR